MEKLSYTVHEVGGHESKDEKLIRTSQHVNKPYQMGLSRSGHDYLIIRGESGGLQRAKKVVSDSPGLVDFAIGLVKSVFNLPDGQVMFFEEFELQKKCEINSARQKAFGAS